jgi:hypothetical protein
MYSISLSPFVWIPRDIFRCIVIECSNPRIFRTCKYFNSFSLDVEFWNKIVFSISGSTVRSFSDDLRFALSPPNSWGSYIQSLVDYEKTKQSYTKIVGLKRINVTLTNSY